MVSGRGGYRPGAGRKKKAEAYENEVTVATRLPESIVEEILPLLDKGKRVRVTVEDDSIAQLQQRIEQAQKELKQLHEENLRLQQNLSAVKAELSQREHTQTNPAQLNKAIALLKSGLDLKPNAGGAIKSKIKEALELINT